MPGKHVARVAPSETGRKQLLYHGRTRSDRCSAHELLMKLPLLSEDEDATNRQACILLVMGPACFEGADGNIMIRGFWRSIIKFAGRLDSGT